MPKLTKADDNSRLTVDTPEFQHAESLSSPISSPTRIIKVNTRSQQATTMSAELDLGILLKFVKSYDGSRDTLNSFIVNCNNAFNLATDTQKPILFSYILCQLQGKAEIACSIKEFNTWDQLKDFLKIQFSERKHYAHLLMDLQESRQGPAENVTQYSLKVETCLSSLLTEISLSTTKQKELPGRTAAMEDLALHHFLMGLHPRLSNIIRCRTPKNLNEAINLAVSEERIQQSLYKKPYPQFESKNNTYNTSIKRFQVQPIKPKLNYQPHSFSSSGPPGLFCRYCKSSGHDIKDCTRRDFYNNRYRDQQQAPRYPGSSFNQPTTSKRINHIQEIQEEDEEVGHDEVDTTLNA